MKLSSEAKSLRKRLLSVYDFKDDPAALLLVDQLVLASDQLRDIQHRLGIDGPIIQGSVGQLRGHPLLGEQERLRRTLVALVRSLRLTLDEVPDA